jgi:hypothetical protein
MRLLAARIGRTLFAGAIGFVQAAGYLVLAMIMSVLLVQAAQAAYRWYAVGTLSLLPPSAPSSRAADIKVAYASPAETAAIRDAVASMRYRLLPNAVTFAITDQLPCSQCGGEYDAGLDLVQVARGLVIEGPSLRHAIAHEIGHYVDHHFLSDALRREYMQLRHIPDSQSWFFDNDQPWVVRPSEDFAEVFAAVSLWPNDAPPQTEYGPVRDPAPYEQLLAEAGVHLDRGLPTPGPLEWIPTEARLVVETLASSSLRWGLVVASIFYLALGTLTAMRDEWND